MSGTSEPTVGNYQRGLEVMVIANQVIAEPPTPSTEPR